MEFEEFKPIFVEPKVVLANSGSGSTVRFLLHVHTPDSSHMRIFVTDFHFNSWESVRSILQLEDMRDNIGIGGSWSEFIDYIVASFKSEDVKLVLEGHSNSDAGPASAKLVAQKSKGMPRIVFALRKVADSTASEAIANLSLELFEAFKSIHHLYIKEREHSLELTKVISDEKEKNESIQSQLEFHSKRQKSQKMNTSDRSNVSSPLISNGQQDNPDKQAPRDPGPTKVANRVVPACRRAKVRGALLQDTEED
ncbi:hypothetical protein CFOL_v3_10841 [Cephalotus follicularis]|uniref:Uncharacterized protein n=1 Tax=Cephalotus follicularis TaxID=3775 RepID=A0A1Q3BHA9_CEPFO|nr:hypothetical protein CFOL_v3_10841 [Cephalotus follicularis]